MFLHSRNDVILIVLTFLLQAATSQRLQEKIDKLPECSNNCIASAATAAGCAADDFACQCQKSDSAIGIVGSILGSASSQNKCLVGDCGVVGATSAQVLLRQICNLLEDTTSSSTSAAPTESTPAAAQPIAGPPETTTPPAPVAEPSPEPSIDFTAPPAVSTSTEQAPISTSTTTTPEPVVESTTSAPPTTSSISIPAFTLPPQTTPQSTTSALPPTTSSTVPPSSSSIPVISSSVPAVQVTLASTSSSSSSSTRISTSSSIQAALLPSSTISTALDDQNETRLLPSSSPTGTSYQAEANQPTPTAQKMTTKRMSPAIIAAIVLGVLSFVILCTFVFVLFRRRQQSLKKQRAISTMTAMSRKSGEEITIYLDLGEEGRKYGGVGKKRVTFRESEISAGKRGQRAKSIPPNVPPSLPVMETGREFNFKFNLRDGLNSHLRGP
ncbi:hypothetical protein BKA64DRAFT_719263 [Cadophora sp. MPI-SDFR-AT-0126]|nr:hypothetical protein BKA64DRAFT_719263 [Leotiomycetes sp. MPI-SDFR-AT-0126]